MPSSSSEHLPAMDTVKKEILEVDIGIIICDLHTVYTFILFMYVCVCKYKSTVV